MEGSAELQADWIMLSPVSGNPKTALIPSCDLWIGKVREARCRGKLWVFPANMDVFLLFSPRQAKLSRKIWPRRRLLTLIGANEVERQY